MKGDSRVPILDERSRILLICALGLFIIGIVVAPVAILFGTIRFLGGCPPLNRMTSWDWSWLWLMPWPATILWGFVDGIFFIAFFFSLGDECEKIFALIEDRRKERASKRASKASATQEATLVVPSASSGGTQSQRKRIDVNDVLNVVYVLSNLMRRRRR